MVGNTLLYTPGAFHIPACRVLTRRRDILHRTPVQRLVSFTCRSQQSRDRSGFEIQSNDANALQTALNRAIAAEDYKLAATIKAQITELLGDFTPTGWSQLGTPEWLAERAAQLGFSIPTEVQKGIAAPVSKGRDVIVRSQTGSGKSVGCILSLLGTLDYPPLVYPDDLKGPQLVFMVPTRELGVQVALLIYKLFGGSINPGVPGSAANMFAYTGPRGIKVRGVLSREEAEFAISTTEFLNRVHVLVGTPQWLAEVVRRGEPVMDHVKAVAVDEVDACIEETPDELSMLLERACGSREVKPQVAFLGATLADDLAQLAVNKGWMLAPEMVRMGGDAAQTVRVPGSIQHRYIRADPARKLVLLCRQLRRDFKEQGEDQPPPRVMVFCGGEAEAQRIASALRSSLWGQHKVAVLLPSGEEPIMALHNFRDNKATLLLATPAAARGLDLPALSHIYSLDLPRSAASYLHRAGRAGRIGATTPGLVTTLVSEEELPGLLGIAQELGIEIGEAPVPELAEGEADVEDAKRDLDDLFNMMEANEAGN